MGQIEENQPMFENVSPAMPYGQIKGEKADMLDKIHPEEVVELLRNRLMGKELNDKRQWVTNLALTNNAISESGAWDISNLILSSTNFNTSISKLDDKEIRRRAYSIMETAIKMVITNFKEYNITNTSQIRFVADIVFSIVFITMKHADAEGIRKMIIGTRTESHQIAQYGETKKKSFFRNN